MGSDTLDGKRVYDDRRDGTRAYVASALGVTRVELSGDRIGRFSLVARCTATSVAGGGRLVVGTDEDVLVGDGREFEPTGFGAAVAVSLADGTPVAAAPDGSVARLRGDDWEPVGSVTGPRRADGTLLAAADGVYRVGEGLTALRDDTLPGDVRDVAAAGPYAATAGGLYYNDGRNWLPELDGDCRLVAAAGGRACAVADDGLYRYDGGWHAEGGPTGVPLAGLAYGESLYAATADGTVLVRAPPGETPDGRGGWRSRALGVRRVAGLAVP